MKKTVLIIMILNLAIARENPFLTSAAISDKSVISSKNSSPIYLDQVSIPFPDSARKIKKITVQYLNSDGSIGVRDLDIDVSIDWHKPLIFTQHINNKQQTANKSAITNLPLIHTTNNKKLKLNSYISYKIIDGGFIIYSKQQLVRDFALPNPYKIALDFKCHRYKKTYEKRIDTKYKKISFGSHREFYRVVMELDGRYTYKIKKINNGIKILLK